MDTESLRTALENAGVTQYEAAAYIALLEHGSATASELAAASDVPQTRIYDVVRDLADRGYVETYREGNLNVRANDPAEVIDDLEGYADTFLDAAEEIDQRWSRPDVKQSKISVVSQPETVHKRAREWIDTATYEVEITATLEQFEALRDVLRDAFERGVVVKLTLTRDPDAESGISGIDQADGPGAADADATVPQSVEGCVTEVRYRDMPTQFLVVVDREYACFTPESTMPAANRYGVLVDDYSLSRIFYWFFQTAMWTTWDVVYSTRTDQLPATYASIRECLAHITPLVKAGHRVVVTVDGFETDGGERIELTGEVSDVVYAGSTDDQYPPLVSFVQQATIHLETDQGRYSIGGWGSFMEDVEGQRFTVELVDRAGS